MLKTIPVPSGVAILSHVTRAASAGVFSLCLLDLGSWESPPSIWLRLLGNLDILVFVIDLRVRD
jgi:hypothetical protein